MNITYEITEEAYSSGASTHISYGIAAYACNEDGDIAIIDGIQNITADKQSLLALVALCNRLELSVLHLREVIDDFLAS